MTAFKKTQADVPILMDRIQVLLQEWVMSVIDMAIFAAELWFGLIVMCFTLVLKSLQFMLGCCCCFCLAFRNQAVVRLTEEDKERYMRLREHLIRPFDRTDTQNRQFLTNLAIVVFGEKQAKAETSDSPLDWESIGFQSDDPSKDIRGGGLVSIEHLTAFAKSRPRKFAEIKKFVEKSDYLLACVSIRLTFFLIDYFGFRNSPSETLAAGLDLDKRRSLKNLALFISRDQTNGELSDPLGVNTASLAKIHNEMLELHFKTWMTLLEDPSIGRPELLTMSEQFVKAAFASLIETKLYHSLMDFLKDIRSFDASNLAESYTQRFRH